MTLSELEAKAQAATACSVCCSPVIHHTGKEGTQFYEAVIDQESGLLETLIGDLWLARAALQEIVHSHEMSRQAGHACMLDCDKPARTALAVMEVHDDYPNRIRG